MTRIFALFFFLLVLSGAYCQYPGTKRGISFGTPPAVEADLAVMSGTLSWFYNWGTGPGSAIDNLLESYGIEYVPMAWNGSFNENNMREFYTNHPEAKYLLGFNEPNFIDQANMTPSQAAAAWPKLEAIADDFGLEIVGPAVNWCGNCVSEGGVTFTDPYEYLDAFFEACEGCRVDYIAVHNYMCYAGPLVNYLDEFKKYGKKIWLTEFACGDQSTITLDMQKSLMLGALDHMDNDTMIFRYAWFLARTSSGSHVIDIFGPEGGTLTELGEIYLYFDARHDTSIYRAVPARIEAESYSDMSGIQIESTSDFDGMANVGWFDAGDWLKFNINVPDTIDYYLYLRVSANQSTSIDVRVDGEPAGSLPVPSTGGWQNWKTFVLPVTLYEGKSSLLLETMQGNFNVNWIRIAEHENTLPVVSAGENDTIILPQSTAALGGEAEDPDGDPMVYRWTKLSGPSCIISDPDSLSTEVRSLVEGTYRFRLTVSDGYDIKSDDTYVVVETASNIAHSLHGEIRVYPNPVDHIMTIGGMGPGHLYTLRLFTAAGRLVKETGIISGTDEMHLDLASLPAGIYVLKIESGSRTGAFRVIK